MLWLALVWLSLYLLAAALAAPSSEVCIAGQVIELGSTASTTPVVCE